MGLREKLNDNPQIVTGVTLAIIAVALVIIVFQISSSDDGPSGDIWITNDQGQTWERAPLSDLYEKDVVQAHIFVSKDGGDPYFAYATRLDEEGRAMLREGGPMIEESGTGSHETLWAPQLDEWIPRDSEEAEEIERNALLNGRPWSPGDADR